MMVKQVWVGSTDVGSMLMDIGGWHVGCDNERHACQAVVHAKTQGYVTTRMHYAPAIPEGSEAYEVTDLGIARVREWWGDEAADRTEKTRQWYRDRTSKKAAA